MARLRRASTVVFTVADESLAAHAAVLLDDLARLHPRWDRVVVSAEGFRIGAARALDARLLTVRDVGLSEAVAFAVSLPEATALSAIVPWGFDALFADGYRQVLFIGPEVRCFASLSGLAAQLTTGDAVLIPRVLQPFNDSLTPGTRELRTAGLFDTSLIGLCATPAARSTIRRWMDAWRNRWLHPDRGTPDDLSGALLELLPAVLDRTMVIRDAGYQVSLWNLHHRELAFHGRRAGWQLLDGTTMRTINFAGLLASHGSPAAVSRQTWPTWVCTLVDEYIERLHATGLRPRTGHRATTLDRLLPIPPAVRQIVLESAAVKGALLTTTSLAAAGALFHDYLRAADADLPVLPRLLAEAYRALPELRRRVDRHPAEQLQAQLEAWHAAEGHQAWQVPLAAARPRRPRQSRSRPGVNLFGYFTSQSGLAEAARSTARALAAPVTACHNVNYMGGSPSLYATPGVPLALPAADPSIEIVHVNCDGVPLFHGTHPEVWTRPSYKIGFWLWELETLPAQARDHARLFNEIWCASTFNHACFQQLDNVVVRLAPLLVNPDLAQLARAPEIDAHSRPLAERPHVFLTVSDFFSCPERKNPLAAIQAYLAAFPHDNGETGLLVKVSNTRIRPDYLEALRQCAHGRRDVRFLLENLDAAELARLVARSAALVSLHTTEGYGLPIAEALALGRPVIATGYGGNVDFCTGPQAHLVSYTMVALQRPLGPYDRGTRWASPDLDDAARAFRAVYQARRRRRDRFQPRVEEFNQIARRGYRLALAAAVSRAASHQGVRLSSTRLKIAVFGASSGGERLARQLQRRHDVVCFLDNDTAKAGSTIMGLPIVSPGRLDTLDVDRILIGSMYHTEIREQLLGLGVPADKMSLHPRGLLADLSCRVGTTDALQR